MVGGGSAVESAGGLAQTRGFRPCQAPATQEKCATASCGAQRQPWRQRVPSLATTRGLRAAPRSHDTQPCSGALGQRQASCFQRFVGRGELEEEGTFCEDFVVVMSSVEGAVEGKLVEGTMVFVVGLGLGVFLSLQTGGGWGVQVTRAPSWMAQRVATRWLDSSKPGLQKKRQRLPQWRPRLHRMPPCSGRRSAGQRTTLTLSL